MSQKPKWAQRRSGREQRRLAAVREHRRRRLIRFGTVVAAALVVVAAIIVFSREQGDALPAVRSGTAAIDATIPREGRVLGDPNAPVTVVEWGDYQ
jgi:protein-disulfide isomerase